MKPQTTGSACARVKLALDEGMAEGGLHLPPDLVAHATRCPRCGPEYRETEALLVRLRSTAAGIDARQLPTVVDSVMATVGETPPNRATLAQRKVCASWALSQLAVVAAVVILVTSGLAYAVLKVNQAVSGIAPQTMVERLTAPLKDWTPPEFRGGR